MYTEREMTLDALEIMKTGTIAFTQAATEVSYWYYCTQPAGYFPYVKACSQAWLKVVPQAPGEQPTAPRVAP